MLAQTDHAVSILSENMNKDDKETSYLAITAKDSSFFEIGKAATPQNATPTGSIEKKVNDQKDEKTLRDKSQSYE